MDIFSNISLILDAKTLALILGSTITGVLIGALPGLSSGMAIALLLPFTIYLGPSQAIAAMAASDCSAAGLSKCSCSCLNPVPSVCSHCSALLSDAWDRSASPKMIVDSALMVELPSQHKGGKWVIMALTGASRLHQREQSHPKHQRPPTHSYRCRRARSC